MRRVRSRLSETFMQTAAINDTKGQFSVGLARRLKTRFNVEQLDLIKQPER